MMKYRILVSAPYMQPVIERLRPRFVEHDCELVIPPVQERLEENDLLALLADIDGVICGDDRFTARVFEAAPRLKVICKWGTGVDSIDREAARRRGIPVHNTPGAFTTPVSDSVLGYMLAFARRLPEMAEMMRAGRWEKIPGRSLSECVVGIIGVGNIGKAVARRAVSFGARVLGNDIVDMPREFLDDTGVGMRAKNDLLEEADFVSLNCDLNPTSRHIVAAPELARMKNSAVLINLARGPLVDEPALVHALQAGEIAGAALDVFEDEPLPAESPLRSMENVMLAPHNSNSSPGAWERVHENSVRLLFESLDTAAN